MPKAPIGSLLLDSYPNAAVAYSLRKLRSAYTGSAIRVRRSVDNVEQDFGFVNNVLDTNSLLDFVGYNLLTYSQDTTKAVYSDNFLNTTGTPPYSGVITAPDGTMTGDKMIESTFSGAHYITYATVSILNATNYNISVYLKQGERTKVQVKSNIDNFERTCDIDLTNGNISNNTFLNTPIVTSEANGWYRFSVTILSAVTSSTIPIRVALLNGSGSIAYTGDGTSGAYIWGLQLSKTSTVKTYQKTVATVGGNGFVTTWYDQSGNANNAINTSATAQPQIVSSGSLITTNGKVTLDFDGSNDRLGFTQITGSTGLTLISVNKYDVISSGTNPWDGSTTITGYSSGFVQDAGMGARVGRTSFYYENNAAIEILGASSSAVINTQYLQFAYGSSTQAGHAVNNTLLTGTAGRNNLIVRAIANDNSQLTHTYYNGTIQEAIIYTSNQASNRAGIQTEINTYYTIY